jgi:predicted MFS family arabinose efflux permease
LYDWLNAAVAFSQSDEVIAALTYINLSDWLNDVTLLTRYSVTVCTTSSPLQGLMFSTPGPTLLALTEIANTNIERITWIFFFRGCGVVTGSVLGGFAGRCRTLTVAITITITSLTFGILPWCTNVVYMYVLIAVYGLSYGFTSSSKSHNILSLG